MSSGAGSFAARRVTMTVNTIVVAGVAPPSLTVTDSGGLTTTTALTGTAAQTFNLFPLAAGGSIFASKIKSNTAFTGGVTALTIEAGTGIAGVGDTARYIPRYNAFLAPSPTGVGHTVTPHAICRSQCALGLAGAGAITLTQAQVGDRVIGVYPTLVASPPVVIGTDIEAVVSIAGQVQQLTATATAVVYIFVLQAGGLMETDGVPSVPTPGVPSTNPAAGTQITGTLRAVGGTGFVNQLTAGQAELFFLTCDFPQSTLFSG